MDTGVSADALVGAAIALVLAALAGLVWISRRMGQVDGMERQLVDLAGKVDEVLSVTVKELNHNGGSSTKDMARDSRDDARAAKKVADTTANLVDALHRRLDKELHDSAFRSGEQKAKLDQIQHTTTKTRTELSWHVHESEQTRQALAEHGIDIPAFTHPDDSPLAPRDGL